jgi:hypothetical protein
MRDVQTAYVAHTATKRGKTQYVVICNACKTMSRSFRVPGMAHENARLHNRSSIHLDQSVPTTTKENA